MCRWAIAKEQKPQREREREACTYTRTHAHTHTTRARRSHLDGANSLFASVDEADFEGAVLGGKLDGLLLT